MPIKSEIKKKIALFGSAFNPPSLGHKSVIDALTHFDQILLLPSIAHAWGKEMLDYETRCHLVELFIQDLNIDRVSLSRLEEVLFHPGEKVTTYRVLTELQEREPDAEITFVIGPDNFLNFHKFYRYEMILKRWSVLVCPERIPVRSTQIRESILKNQPIKDLTTPSVAQFLTANSVYS